MKQHTTRKYIKSLYGDTLISIPYCKAQFLLAFKEPQYFNSGVYGWNCDYYLFSDIAICTGYRPHGTHINYELIEEYEVRAEKIYNSVQGYENRKEKINKLLNEFLTKALNEI